MKKSISILLTLVLVSALLTSCSGTVSGNPGVTSNDLVDSSATQQRWLRMWQSNLVINPDEYAGGASGNFNRLALNVGYLDLENNTVTHKVNDIMFLLENNTANGIGGDVIYEPIYDQDAADVNMRFTKSKVNLFIDGTKITADIVEGDDTSTQSITMRNKVSIFEVPENKDLVATIDVISSGGMWKLAGSTMKPPKNILAQNDSSETGHFAFNITEMLTPQITAEEDTTAMTMTMTLTMIGALKTFVFDNYRIVAIDKGFHYGDAEPSTTWYPHGIISSLKYPNGTAAEVMDYFAEYNVVARKITFKENGSFTLAGKVDGTIEFDSKKTLMKITGNGFNYVVAPKKKQYITFYSNEADMLARANGTTEPTADTQYWTVSCGRLEIGSDLYVAVAFDTTKSLDELATLATEAVKAGNTAKRIEKNVTFWTQYIEQSTLPSEYIKSEAPAPKE